MKNKDADQLRGNREAEADLRLCFCICRLLVFSCGGSFLFCDVRYFEGFVKVILGKCYYLDISNINERR